MRQTLSPGWQTHLMFAEFDGVVAEHDDHIVVRSPRSPGYYWGNFLLYNRMPSGADFGPRMQRFNEAIVQPAPTLTFAARACAVHWCMGLAHRASRTWAGHAGDGRRPR